MKYSLLLIILLVSCQSIRPTIIAHRGLPRLFPEHTLKGFVEAMKYDIDYIEPDIVLTKDLVPVILHDTHLDTTTNVAILFPHMKREDGHYYAIDFTLKEIKSLNANHRIDLKTKKSAFDTRPLLINSPHMVPTLEELISTVIKQNKRLNKSVGIYLELKEPAFHSSMNTNITKITHDILIRYKQDLKIIIQCFDDKPLRYLKKIKSPFKRVQLIADNSWRISSLDYSKMLTKKGMKVINTYAHGIGPWIPMLLGPNKSPNKVTTWAHQNNLVVHPYTVRNDKLFPGIKTEKQLLVLLFEEIGVDGVFTDNVNTTSHILKQQRILSQ